MSTSQKLTITFAIIFLIVGVLGLITNPIVGGEGIFDTNLPHNALHFVFALLFFLAFLKGEGASRVMMRTLAAIYFLLVLLAFSEYGLTGKEGAGILGLGHKHVADNWLHLLLAIALYISTLFGTTKKTEQDI